jgi:hypothetical protein
LAIKEDRLMGSFYEFNWILKLSEEQGFAKNYEIGLEYAFTKTGCRIYPIGPPIDLVDNSWVAVAQVVVTSVTLSQNATKGTYMLLRLYEGAEKSIRTQGWREVLRTVTGADHDSYTEVRITNAPPWN